MLSSVRLSVAARPATHTLASVRTFPALEPYTMAPYPAQFLNHPLRRDLLWSAVVFEADRARVGSGNVPTKGDQPFSHKKLRPQKRTGRARVGDANSPTRDNGIKAHGIKAGHDWLTLLPRKVYARAMQTALSEQYRSGHLNVVDALDLPYTHTAQVLQFVQHHGLEKLHLLFVTSEERRNLVHATAALGAKTDVLTVADVEVRDVLKANRVFIEQDALNWLVGEYM